MATKASLLKAYYVGKHLAKAKTPTTPQFTVKDFLKGVEEFSQESALDFIVYCNKMFKNKAYNFTDIEEEFTLPISLDKDILYECLQSKGNVVFIKNGEIVDEFSYRKLINILEYGKKDKGISPDPVLRIAFVRYREIFKKRLKSFLIGQ